MMSSTIASTSASMISSASTVLLKQTPLDVWSTREHLCLASAVLRSGDQNWASVSRTLKSFGEPNRPPDWFSQKNCAVQYARLLETVEAPKRKREKGEPIETPGETIVKKLRTDRIEELRGKVQRERQRYMKYKEEVRQLKAGLLDDRLDEIYSQIQEEKRKKEEEEEKYKKWLADREQQKMALQQAIRAANKITPPPPPSKRIKKGGGSLMFLDRRDSSHSEASVSSEMDSVVDSPASEAPVTVEVADEATSVESKPNQPSSPLLTSLLRSPAGTTPRKIDQPQASGGSPTLSRLLDSPASGKILPRLSLFSESVVKQEHGEVKEEPIVKSEEERHKDSKEDKVVKEEKTKEETINKESPVKVEQVESEPLEKPNDKEVNKASKEPVVELQEVVIKEEPQDVPEVETNKKELIVPDPVIVVDRVTKDEVGKKIEEEQVEENKQSVKVVEKVVESNKSVEKIVQSNVKESVESDTESTVARNILPTPLIESVPNSPASGVLSGEETTTAEERRDYKIWKKSMLLLWRDIAGHKYASLFTKPITNDDASGYRDIVLRPMDLQTIKRNIETGTITSTLQFQRDLMLMFTNAMMYNSSDHEIHEMARTMLDECVQKIEILLQVEETNRQTKRRGEVNIKETEFGKRKRSADEKSQQQTRKRR